MRILFYGETPTLETGASRVNRHLLDVLVEMGVEIEVIGTSHFYGSNYNRERFPYNILDVQGSTQIETHQNAGKMIVEREGTYDVLFVSGDMHVPNILIEPIRSHPSIVLAAIDGVVKHSSQVISLEAAMVPVVYSHFAHHQVLQHLPNIGCRLQCIPLGADPDDIYPLSYEEKREYRKKAFNIDDDTFLVMWCNRNQIRKDGGRAMLAFHHFHKAVPNSRLFMCCRKIDHGGNITNQAFLLGLKTTGPDAEVIFTGDDFTESAGYSRDVLNKMYNAANLGISTTQGEGFGLTTTDFMCAGTPFIGPDNTTFPELLGNGSRGYLVESGGPNLWSIFYGTDDAPRPLTNVLHMAQTMEYVYRNREEAIQKALKARQWTLDHTWEHMKDQWRVLIAGVANHVG